MTLHRLVYILLPALMIPLIGLIVFLIVRPGLAQPRPSIWIEADSSMDIDIPAGSASRLYSFSANPQHETLLKLDTDNPDFAFAAEVRDSKGQSVALLNGEALHHAMLSIAPGDGVFQVAVSAAAPDAPGTVSLSVGAPPTPAPTEPPAPICGIVSAVEAGINVYSGPRGDYAVVAALFPGDMLIARGRIRGGWYVGERDGQFGWVPGDVVRLYGECANLPLVLDPSIPGAPADHEPRVMRVDRDGQAQITQEIAYPYDDTADTAWLNVVNLHNQPPANYREFTLTLTCEGVGTEYVRWGAPESPTMACGESIVMPFMYGLNRQPVLVSLPEGSEQSYVRYTLSVVSSQRAV